MQNVLKVDLNEEKISSDLQDLISANVVIDPSQA